MRSLLGLYGLMFLSPTNPPNNSSGATSLARNDRMPKSKSRPMSADDDHAGDHQVVAVAGVARVDNQEAEPELTAIISAATTTSQPTPRVIRMPMISWGMTAGKRHERRERPCQAEIAAGIDVNRGNAAHGIHRSQQQGEEAAQKDEKDGREIADTEPENGERDPGQW